jgi:hypothetical protein
MRRAPANVAAKGFPEFSRATNSSTAWRDGGFAAPPTQTKPAPSQMRAA